MSDQPGYFQNLFSRFGEGWNRFWFTPSDPLPLGGLRIGVGLIVLYLAATFGLDLRRFFDPQTGLLPVNMVIESRSQLEAFRAEPVAPARFSYFDYANDAATLQAMHYAGLLVLAAYTVGLFTRVTSVLAFVVFLSYFHRAPMLGSVVDPVLAFLLFYLCLGPCGAELSLDAWRRNRAAGARVAAVPTYAATVSLRLIQVHTALCYFLMSCGKQQGGGVWWNGTAVWWLIARPESAMIDLRWMNEMPYLINIWTTAIFLFEPLFALLIWVRVARPLLVGLSVVVWASIAVLTGMVPFALAMIVASLSFIDAETWRRMLRR